MRTPDVDVHERHDPALVSALVAGDLAGPELDLALARVRDCGGCASLADDLRLLATVVRSLPAAGRPAGLDFRLRPDVAAGLDRHRGWRRLLRPLASPRLGARLLAPALTTLGLVGLLVSGLPLLGSSAGGAATMAEADHGQPSSDTFPGVPATSSRPDASAGTPDPRYAGNSAAPGAVSPSAPGPDGVPSTSAAPGVATPPAPADGKSASQAPAAEGGASPAPADVTGTSAPPLVPTIAPGSPQVSPSAPSPPSRDLVGVSVALLVLGLATFGLRRRARRLP